MKKRKDIETYAKNMHKNHADINAGLKAFYIFACSCTTRRGFVMFEIRLNS